MGQHNAKPDKLPKKVHDKTHQCLVFCKHWITELSAGFFAIIIFEAYREDWLGLLGTHETHAITTFLLL